MTWNDENHSSRVNKKSNLIMISTGVSPSSSLPAEELSVCDRTTSGSQRASSHIPRGVHITDDNVLTDIIL